MINFRVKKDMCPTHISIQLTFNKFVEFCRTIVATNSVKSSENLQAKSLKSFVEKYNTKINVRTSMSNYREEEWLCNIPLYCIGNIIRILEIK